MIAAHADAPVFSIDPQMHRTTRTHGDEVVDSLVHYRTPQLLHVWRLAVQHLFLVFANELKDSLSRLIVSRRSPDYKRPGDKCNADGNFGKISEIRDTARYRLTYASISRRPRPSTRCQNVRHSPRLAAKRRPTASIWRDQVV
jgi:hypothetical protein